jgi:hypothetical protein
VEGSRPVKGFDPEVPDVHPLAQNREPVSELVTEAWDWHRPLTDAEKTGWLGGGPGHQHGVPCRRAA